ncbi:hypothetical protein GCM10009839_79270 [Catenulispora yoronensis]|uniref:Uncharacterized protein n=1 Tax=Catenulispora yoronensis TaxID=450799 RepID=A0ABN2VB32_9ACTN
MWSLVGNVKLGRNTTPAPMNPTPVTTPANAFGAPPSFANVAMIALPTPISENVRSPAGDPRRSRSNPNAYVNKNATDNRPSCARLSQSISAL